MMNKHLFKSVTLTALTLITVTLAKAQENKTLELVPYPQKIEFQTGHFIPPKDLQLSYEIGQAAITPIVQTCVLDLATIGFSASSKTTPTANQTGSIKLIIKGDTSLGNEGYRLTIDKNISIAAATTDGLFLGTRTLLQLLHAGPQKAIPHLTITDQPEFPYRGLLIDNARKFHSIDFHINMIKRVAALKLNRYQIHFSDHQSYTLPSTAFPNLPTKDRHYTRAQIKKLVQTAQQYHVQIVPEIDVPSHARALTTAISSLSCTKQPNGKICIGDEKTYQTLETLFSEIMEMIPGNYWHLGADDVHYRSIQCDACANRIKKEKLETGTQLYHYFINRMYKVMKSKGRKMLVSEGFDPTLSPMIDKEIIVCPFDIKHKGHMPSDYFKAGYQILNTPVLRKWRRENDLVFNFTRSTNECLVGYAYSNQVQPYFTYTIITI